MGDSYLSLFVQQPRTVVVKARGHHDRTLHSISAYNTARFPFGDMKSVLPLSHRARVYIYTTWYTVILTTVAEFGYRALSQRVAARTNSDKNTKKGKSGLGFQFLLYIFTRPTQDQIQRTPAPPSTNSRKKYTKNDFRLPFS